jgi:16S rRNA (guanine527-N7)-methyltransferase
MEAGQIAELLQPYLNAPASLNAGQLRAISIYIELLRRWNARVNLTAVRDPERIVTRHFGESLFLAAQLFPSSLAVSGAAAPQVADLGSGAGFPGLPLKIYVPELRLTLVESNHKKAAFLSEVIRALGLSHARVFSARLELGRRPGQTADVPPELAPPDLVTMRAVERFEQALATAAGLIRSAAGDQKPGRLALLLGRTQADRVPQLILDFLWQDAVPVPQSRERVLLIGQYPNRNVSRG